MRVNRRMRHMVTKVCNTSSQKYAIRVNKSVHAAGFLDASPAGQRWSQSELHRYVCCEVLKPDDQPHAVQPL